VLWVLGDVKLLARPGNRGWWARGIRHRYGTGMAELLARDLASHRMVIPQRHGKGRRHRRSSWSPRRKRPAPSPCGVTGVDVIYPKENKSLAENILVAGGAIVSELQVWAPFPAPQKLSPSANRIHQWHKYRRAGGGSRREIAAPG